MKTIMIALSVAALGAVAMTNKPLTVKNSAKNHSGSGLNAKLIFQSDALMRSMNNMMQQMHAQKMTGNTDLDFASMLRIHHLGAIDLAKIELKQGKDEMMRKMAQKIIDAQTREVTELDKMIPTLQNGAKNYDPTNKNSGTGKAMNDNMMSMMKMGNMSMSSVDHEFADMMTKHHKDGVMMAESILAHAKNGKLRSMAQKSIPEQTSDISKMEQWMKSHK